MFYLFLYHTHRIHYWYRRRYRSPSPNFKARHCHSIQ